MGLLYQDLIRRKQVLAGQRLPPVLPIVRHNGKARGRAAKDVAVLISTPPGLVAKYIPRLSYLLIVQHQYADEDFAKLKNLTAAMIRVEHAARHEMLPQVEVLIQELVAGNPELDRALTTWIPAVLSNRSSCTVALPDVKSFKDIANLVDWGAFRADLPQVHTKERKSPA